MGCTHVYENAKHACGVGEAGEGNAVSPLNE